MKLLLSLVLAVVLGAQRTSEYLPLLEGKSVALFTNHTGTVPDGDGGYKHTLDLMMENGVEVKCVFAPEHGFRGTAGPGERVQDSVDEATGVEIRSLFTGKGRAIDLSDVDVVVCDIQDVGARFYTYYITMISLMEAAAAQGKSFIVLDRPNPNGMYMDGPILEPEYRSGVGRLPIPVVHSLTLGELALMANAEGWLDGGLKVADLRVITCLGYDKSQRYVLPVKPSPNLPNMHSIYLYPSVCLFEATPLSVGRGTPRAFQMYGCIDLGDLEDDYVISRGLDLEYIMSAWKETDFDPQWLSPWFEKLLGTPSVRKMILEGKSADEIKACWAPGLEKFRELSKPYLLYSAEEVMLGSSRP